jgi:23S rRNA pseudouridine955/2504/2580 synthase
MIEGLRRIREETKFLELVHRLDRDTSGCLVVAKKRGALRALHEQFRGKEVGKVYTALLDGVWRQSSRTVAESLEKNVLQSGERLVKCSEHGKHAVTIFRRLRLYRALTLVEAEPLTGRTHQIRVHAKCLGHPIAGDERYGASERARELRRMGLRRLFLHASRVSFTHPSTREALSVEAPLAPELVDFLQGLQ